MLPGLLLILALVTTWLVTASLLKRRGAGFVKRNAVALGATFLVTTILGALLKPEREPDPEIVSARPSEPPPEPTASAAPPKPRVVATAAAARPEPAPSPLSVAAPEPVRPWYSGGTLHNATALEWQNASAANKLATCADLVVAMKEKGFLKPEIAERWREIDDYKVPAAALVVAIDKATVGVADPEKNRRMLANQTVSGLAATLVAMMGWIG
jgi:hypothetical protein